ncbi:DNA-3-methyladenine glycosylase family protein [Pseudocnuella soli]|uniref:DNA-3-methyladenine glycosylase family protein n=1 Tax=Pseudocnuella soli TaxID=2502779 RepID=UPI001F02B219|nr:DNA-3-methyladenine glycosylase 2 family protein [Pseudocnuella soli]
MEQFDKSNYEALVQQLCSIDEDLTRIVEAYGMPPLWTRPNSFATLVLTILEQQVSLQAAFAAYTKLEAAIGEPTPEKILAMSDAELRACYFTRQKTGYVRGLATAIYSGQMVLAQFEAMPDEQVRQELTRLKGIGPWTADIYLLHAMRRTDIFPLGDLALVLALRDVKGLDKSVSKETMLVLAEPWRPYRSVATMVLWHYYLSRRKSRVALR